MGEWAGELSPRTSLLAASDDLPLLLGHFRCPPDDPAWAEVNHIGRLSLVVFPRTAVTISPERSGPLTADANRVVLYDPGQRYRRGLLDPRGDDCLFVALGPDLLARVAGAAVRSDGTALRFVGHHRSCPAKAWRAVHRVRSLVAAPVQDGLAIEESLLGLVEDVFAAAGDRPDAAPTRRAVPMTEATRAVLADRYREDLTLGDVATEVGVSKYHLHRTFRAATGWTIHAYRDHLRLREGLARVLDGEPDLSMLAFDLGFSSHSHFTDRFRRAFGVTPSHVRRDGAVSSRR